MQNFTIKHLLSLLVLGVICTSSVHAQSYLPFIDKTFSDSGLVYLHDMYRFYPQTQAMQSDGKILVAGYGSNFGNSNIPFDGIVYRINENGTKDLTFGANGFRAIDIDGSYDAITGIAETADHKIIMVFTSFTRTILVRLLPDGSYDPDFGNDGILLTEASNTEGPQDLIIQPDQKIVICGFQQVLANLNKGYIRRFNPDGSPDASFGTNGYVSCVIDAVKNFELSDLALQPDGKILATGVYANNTSSSGFPVIRLNTDGSFDNTFSSDGIYVKVMGNSTRPANARCIALRPDGKILVGGVAPTTSESAMTVVQVKPDGITDTNFGSFGAAKVVVSWYNEANSLMLQPDGKVVVGGYCFISDTSTANLMVRLNTSGVQDITFGPSDGYFATVSAEPGFNVDVISGLQVLPTGKMLVTSWVDASINANAIDRVYVTVSRYLTDIVVETYEPNLVFQETHVFPSPVKDELVTLQYTMDNAREVSVLLFDANGREITTLIDAEMRSAGQQQEQFYLPVSLPAGNYFLELATDDGRKAIQLVKL
jgi:uncharacterized delta-60 repeat protein